MANQQHGIGHNPTPVTVKIDETGCLQYTDKDGNRITELYDQNGELVTIHTTDERKP